MRAMLHFRRWGFFLFFLSGACATPPAARENRRLATVSPIEEILDCGTLDAAADRRFCALVKRDALDALGLLVTKRILEAKWETMRAHAEKEGDASSVRSLESNRESESNTLSGSLAFRDGSGYVSLPRALSVSGAHAGIGTVLMVSFEDLNKLTPRHFFIGPGISLVTTGISALFTASSGQSTNRQDGSTAFSLGDSLMGKTEIDGKGLRNKSSFGTVPDAKRALPEAEHRLAFRRRIREVSGELAARAATVLDLRATQKLRLEGEIEKRLDTQFARVVASGKPSAKTAPRSGSKDYGTVPEVRIDVLEILESLKIDVRPRVRALEAIIAQAGAAEIRFVSKEAVGQRKEALQAMDRELSEMLTQAETHYRELDQDDEPALAALLEEVHAYMRQCEGLRRMIRAHRAIAPATATAAAKEKL